MRRDLLGLNMDVVIHTKQFVDGFWHVEATVSDEGGTRRAHHLVALPETATEARLITAIKKLY
jgi:hypothetical protein